MQLVMEYCLGSASDLLEGKLTLIIDFWLFNFKARQLSHISLILTLKRQKQLDL